MAKNEAADVKAAAEAMGINEETLREACRMGTVQGLIGHPFTHFSMPGFWNKFEGLMSLLGRGCFLGAAGFGGYKGVKYIQK